MINISGSKHLGIILPNTNKALKEVLQNATPQELATLSKGGKDLQSILDNILKQSLDTTASNKELLNLVKNNPTLKSLGNVSATIKDILSIINSKDSLLPIETKLKEFLTDIKDLTPKELENKLKNSGIFLESKLKHLASDKQQAQKQIQDILANDLKAIVSKASDELSKSSQTNQSDILKQIDKLALQIDNYQLISHLSSSAYMYLPFSWDQLQEGNIEIKPAKEDKFFTDINLTLKEYGELNLKLVLYDKNQLNTQMYVQSPELKSMIQENIRSLRSALIEANITPREIRLFDIKEENSNTSAYRDTYEHLNMGFEVKV